MIVVPQFRDHMGCGASDARVQADKSASSGPPAGLKADAITIRGGDFEDPSMKILILGASESGKSTISRQVKLLYCGGFTDDERSSMKPIIRVNVMADIQTLLATLKSSGQTIAPELLGAVEFVSGLQLTEDELTRDVANEISRLWADPSLKAIYEASSSMGFGDNAGYFLDRVNRIAANNYVPNEDDMLRMRVRTTGVPHLNFFIDQVKTQLVDVGGQTRERASWPIYFNETSFLMFVVSLSDFDQETVDDASISRTTDSMDLFDSIANSPPFTGKPIFLVLNKLDVFQRKLGASPDRFKCAYPGFNGDPADVEQAVEHVTKSYMERINSGRPDGAGVEAIAVCATDNNSIRELVQTIAKTVLGTNPKARRGPF
jgi:GTPase SAR1 family protein